MNQLLQKYIESITMSRVARTGCRLQVLSLFFCPHEWDGSYKGAKSYFTACHELLHWSWNTFTYSLSKSSVYRCCCYAILAHHRVWCHHMLTHYGKKRSQFKRRSWFLLAIDHWQQSDNSRNIADTGNFKKRTSLCMKRGHSKKRQLIAPLIKFHAANNYKIQLICL